MRPASALAAVLVAASLAAGCASSGNEKEAVAAMRESVLAAQANDFGKAEIEAQRALALRPGFVDPLMMLAALAERTGDLETARGHYREVLRSDPTDTAAGVALGFTYVREQRFDEARSWFEKAIVADPGCEPAAYNLGSLAAHAEDPDTAIAWFRVAAALDRRDPRALVEIAKVELGRGRAQEAVAAADDALRRYPSSRSAQTVRAQALASLRGN